jgi:hypothetical protein
MIRTALGFITGGSFTRLGATLLIGFSAGAWGAHWVTSAAYRLERTKITERASKDLARAVEQQDRAITDYLKDQDRARTEYRTITRLVDKIVERPVYRNVCLDDDGMQQLRAAIAGRADQPGPATAVPAAR